MPEPMIGRPAPEFDLASVSADRGEGRSRSVDFRGRWLALVFYPRDFSLVCPTELTALADRIDEFEAIGCGVLGVSCDPLDSHRQWMRVDPTEGGLGRLPFPLASDEDGRVSRAFGVYQDPPGVSLRGLFLIDPAGLVQYQVVHSMGVGRRADEVLRVLGALTSGGMCASGWGPGDATIDPTKILGPGRVVAHYRIDRKLGSGTFAAVFLARDETLKRPVALKVLRPRPGARPRALLDEARAAAALNHPNICTVYAVDDSEGLPIIAMEYVAGPRLDHLIASGGLTVGRSVGIARQVASGMAAAHEAGVVHGDLKPQNILVDVGDLAKIVDFGLAHRVGAPDDPFETIDSRDLSSAGITGTPGYMAPEQTRGEPSSPASDVFAMGSILFELLTGHRAIGAGNVLQVFEQIRNTRPRAPAEQVPAPFSPIIRGALEPEPDRRAITMREIADLLADAPGSTGTR
ncbi:protein kinase domain-containing protein [Tautonia plasticadhaerens]|uniref:Serine/threonine-protein kinase PrkC n=1 Tax=Tautonia plasticadhaerens TaxID=2527974 RepID=A0A518HBC7_9BACT|nr:protein kinase [Tautonia plasticadhaerens]QDV38165.1 Serine/threonine-protein kinase PrkC [Tautonia plasticadhaerens]